MTTGAIRVLCVEDNPDVGEVLAACIAAEPDLENVGLLASAEGLAEEIAARKPDVMLMDLTMPGRDPLDALAESVARFPGVRTVVVSGYDDQARIDRAVECGAWGFVPKHAGVSEIIEAVRSVAGGRVWLKNAGG